MSYSDQCFFGLGILFFRRSAIWRMQLNGIPCLSVFTRLSPGFLLSSIVRISSRRAVRLVDGDSWLKLLPVADINTGDGAVGVFQQNLVTNEVQHQKTAARFVVVDATDDRSLTEMLFQLHIDVPLLLRGD